MLILSTMDFVLKVSILAMLPLIREARIITSREGRLSLAEPSPQYFYSNINGYPGTYAFGYDVKDPHTGDLQFRHEERYPNGTVAGSYGYTDGNRRPVSYRYIADEKGYRIINNIPQTTYRPAQINYMEKEPSVTWTRPKKNKPNKDYPYKPNKNSNYIKNVLLPPSYYAVD